MKSADTRMKKTRPMQLAAGVESPHPLKTKKPQPEPRWLKPGSKKFLWMW